MMYRALNADLEESHDPFRKGGGVFAKCTKVDNSVRLSTAMHAQELQGVRGRFPTNEGFFYKKKLQRK